MKPTPKKLSSQYVIELRDDIAITALEGLLAAGLPMTATEIAEAAYKLADAMVAERVKK